MTGFAYLDQHDRMQLLHSGLAQQRLDGHRGAHLVPCVLRVLLSHAPRPHLLPVHERLALDHLDRRGMTPWITGHGHAYDRHGL